MIVVYPVLFFILYYEMNGVGSKLLKTIQAFYKNSKTCHMCESMESKVKNCQLMLMQNKIVSCRHSYLIFKLMVVVREMKAKFWYNGVKMKLYEAEWRSVAMLFEIIQF